MAVLHKDLAQGRWQKLSLLEQMANIGSEVGRTIKHHEKGDKESFLNAFQRALELFDLSLADPRWGGPRLKELARDRELFCSLFYGNGEYSVSAEPLDRYFFQFGLAARNQKVI